VINCRTEAQKVLPQDAQYSRTTPSVKNLDELKAVLINVWDNKCLVMIKDLVARVARVIAEDGYTMHHL
jgi:hypothetical protein